MYMYVHDLVQDHCCVGVNEGTLILSNSGASETHQLEFSCIPVEKDLRIETSWI